MPTYPTTYIENDTDTVDDLPAVHPNFDPNTMVGRVLYTYGLSLDQPVEVIRMGYGRLDPSFSTWAPIKVTPLWNLRGEAELAYLDDGRDTLSQQASGGTQHTLTAWRMDGNAYGEGQLDRYRPWFGTLLTQKQDETGTFYRRNRYYDPTTGRFTQEDPIGLAGGVNLYGFAGGDPINFSDPFGLCPWCLVPALAGGGALTGAAGGGFVGGAIAAGAAAGAAAAGVAVGGFAAGYWIGSKINDALSDMSVLSSGRSKNDIPLVGGPPNGIVTKPGTSVVYGPDGNATSRTCASGGHGCEGAHTHIYVTGPNGKVNQKGQPRPATQEEKDRTPPPRKPDGSDD